MMQILDKIKRFVEKLARWLPMIYLGPSFFVFSRFFRKGQYILFGTGTGLYHDNARHLYEYALKNSFRNLQPIWVAKNNQVFNALRAQGKPVVKRRSLQAAYFAGRARAFYVTAEVMDVFYFLAHRTLLIQLWHGIPIKRIGFDNPRDASKQKRNAQYFIFRQYMYERIDNFIIESQGVREIFRSAFRLPAEKFFAFGQARNALMSQSPNSAKVQLLKKNLGLDSYTRVLLYAPTFRDDLQKNIDLIQGFVNSGREWLSKTNTILIVKLHPFLINGQVGRLGAFLSEVPNVINLSAYEDTQELLLISDALITDYSSIVLDYAHTGRQAFLYRPDFKEYCMDRGGIYQEVNDYVDLISKRIISLPEVAPGSLQKLKCHVDYCNTSPDLKRMLELAFNERNCQREQGGAQVKNNRNGETNHINREKQ